MEVEAPNQKMLLEEKDETGNLELTKEEALALLIMCMLSPVKLDKITENAMRKLSEFCRFEQQSATDSR